MPGRTALWLVLAAVLALLLLLALRAWMRRARLARASHGAASAGALAPAPPLRVLVVDDNVDAARASEDLLRAWGHEPRVAPDGPAALAEAPRFAPDVVLLDIGLPGMDGFEVARALRARGDLAGCRLIALTGSSDGRDRRTAADAGFDAYLTKPLDLARMRRLLDEEKSRRRGGTV